MKNAPVVVFAYKRVDKLEKCLESLNRCVDADKSDLYIFCDGAKGELDSKDVNEVRSFIDEYKSKLVFLNVVVSYRERNIGLANSIICGVTKILDIYDRVIVVEDDLIVSYDFLVYMNKALLYYQDDNRYGSVSAYTLPLKQLSKYEKDVYVTRKADCWGWGTWRNRWSKVDWEIRDYLSYKKNIFKRIEFNRLQVGLDKMLCRQLKGEIDSWAVRWCYHAFCNKLLTVYPRESRTTNIGVDGTGTHNSNIDIYCTNIVKKYVECKFEKLDVSRPLEHAASVYERNESYKRCLRQLLNNWRNR